MFQSLFGAPLQVNRDKVDHMNYARLLASYIR